MTEVGRWQWWPLHGGAGVTTLAQVEPRGRLSGPGNWSPDEFMVVVARTSASGLLQAKAFASQDWPGASMVVGLVTVADAPGRLPTGLRHLRRHVAGGYRHAWHIDRVERWRCGEPVTPETTPRAVRSVMNRIADRVAHADPHGFPLVVQQH